MSRSIEEVLKSGYLTASERLAIDFAEDLEANEEEMSEGAAMALTCEEYGLEHSDISECLLKLPDGEWWKARDLPTKDMKP